MIKDVDLLVEDYQDNRGLSSGLAVVMIDMQPTFIDDVDSLERSLLMASHRRLIEGCMQKNIPLIAVEFMGYDATSEHLTDMLGDYENAYRYLKREENAFSATYLANVLQACNINTLFFTGLNATGCVLKSMRGARANRLNVMTADDIIANGGYLEADRNTIRALYDMNKINYLQSYAQFLRSLQ